jgi:hypothetical protein
MDDDDGMDDENFKLWDNWASVQKFGKLAKYV